MKELLPFERMWPTVASGVVPLGVETVPILEGVGRVLRASARAAWDLPAADNSAMDGYALRSEDSRPAPAVLRVLEADAYAGSESRPRVEPGTCARIGTGGVLPEGADSVIPRERVQASGDSVTLDGPVEPGANVRRRGEELCAEDVLAHEGDRITAVRMAALATGGVSEVTVSAKPRVAVLSTGNELVAPGVPLPEGGVVDTNAPFLRACLRRLLDVEIPPVPPVRDDEAALRAALDTSLSLSDVLVVTGGMSVGDRDLAKEILEGPLGVERVLWRVAQKPGKPVYVGRRGPQWVVGLPGNPAAVTVLWHVLLRPLLLALMGASSPEPRRMRARLGTELRPDSKRTVLRWSRAVWGEHGLEALPLEKSASHMLSDLSNADLLSIVPPGTEPLPPGTVVEAIDLQGD